MNELRRRALPLLILSTCAASATEIDTQVIDGLGRPVDGVEIGVSWYQEEADGAGGKQVDLFRGSTGADGRVRITYDDALLPAGEFRFVELAKPGYAGYSSSELESEFVLRRQVAQTFTEIAALPAAGRLDALRERLAADENEDTRQDGHFYEEAALREPLRALVDDPHVARQAIFLLAEIGVPADLDHIIAHKPPMLPLLEQRPLFDNRWAYSVATALVNPPSEAAWAFLEACASGAYDDGWVDAGAIFALLLSEPTRASQVLQLAAERNAYRADWLRNLIANHTTPPEEALSNRSPEAAAAALGPTLIVGRFVGAGEPRYNRAKDKALINVDFRKGRDYLVYTATYHREADGLWHLRGVRETSQMLLAGD